MLPDRFQPPNCPRPMNRIEEVFTGAADLPAPERGVYLDTACAGDPALRQRVEELLRCHDGSDSLLAAPLAAVALEPLPVEEKPCDRIGRYKLLEQIGEGGCGVVWMAEQVEPVRRRVALKIIRLGMDTHEVVARFEAERQALALMDHPNIARVFDGGATAQGRPYFVMELVRGLPITRYCDEARLTPAQRLELFIAVCLAVQHAHQKGVIHRDLKPSNVLVTMNDGVPVPKVIDFGVAKATQGPLTDKTLFTAFQQFIGTPVYMSPEQADLSSVDIDTRSDIYSLGVLLYELLTGAPPFDPKKLAAGGVDEIRRVLREVEPARPSARLATLDEPARTTLSHQRSLAVHELSVALRGDLDWIVMRCLEKDRARRYASVGALVADLRRHLAHEPVVARPPSPTYRLRKFIRRHRLGVGAGVLVFLSLIAGLAVATTALVREKRARQETLRAEQLSVDARRNAENLLTFIVSKLGEDLDEVGLLPTLRKLNRQVLAYYEQLNPTLQTRETRAGLAFARTGLSGSGWFNSDRTEDFHLGDSHAEQCFAAARHELEVLEASGPLTPFMRVAYAGVLWGLAGHRYREGRGTDGLPFLIKAEELLQPVLTNTQWGDWAEGFITRIIVGRGFLTNHYGDAPRADRRAAAGVEYRRALARAETRARQDINTRRAGLQAAEIRWRLSQTLPDGGPESEARRLITEAQQLLRELLEHEPYLVAATTCLANTHYRAVGFALFDWRFEQARRDSQEALRLYEHVVKSDPAGWGKNAWRLAALVNRRLGKFNLDWLQGDFTAAEAGLRDALAWLVRPQAPADSRMQLLGVRYDLARLYAATHRDAEADRELAEARRVAQRIATERPWLSRSAYERLLADQDNDESQVCNIEAQRLRWDAVQDAATRVVAAVRSGGGEKAATSPPPKTVAATLRHLMQVAFEKGDYLTARRELEAWSPPAEILGRDAGLEARFQRVSLLLTRIQVLTRAGEVDTARSELAPLWSEAEAIFAAGRDCLFVRIEHARALSLRAEVEPDAAATRRQWLEQAAGLLRPAAAAGRLTRYQREVLLHRIEQQLAALEGGSP